MNCVLILVCEKDGEFTYTCQRCAVKYRSRYEANRIKRICAKGSRPCLHRGEQVGLRECASCAGLVKLKLFACAIHGECTLAKPLEGVACCGACREFEGESGT